MIFCPTKTLVGHVGHDEGAVVPENDDVIDIGAIAHKFILSQRGACKSLFAVHIELLVGCSHLCCFDGIKAADLGLAVRGLCRISSGSA